MRQLYYLIFNGGMLLSGYYGLFENVQGARYIFLFLVWWSVVGATTVYFNTKTHAIIKEKGRAMPVHLDVCVDLGTMFMLIWTGHWIAGVFFLIHTIIGLIIYGDGGFKELEDE
jgi:hypothetical protein